MTRQRPIDSKGAIDEGQSTRFIEAARAAGASEDEAVFDANLRKIVKAKLSSAAGSRKSNKAPRG